MIPFPFKLAITTADKFCLVYGATSKCALSPYSQFLIVLFGRSNFHTGAHTILAPTHTTHTKRAQPQMQPMKRRVNRKLGAAVGGDANSLDDCDDSSESSNQLSSSQTPSLVTTNEEDAWRTKLICREERHVRKARCAVAGAMLVCAIALSIAVYIFAARAEYTSFLLEVQLLAYMERVIVSFSLHTWYLLSLLATLTLISTNSTPKPSLSWCNGRCNTTLHLCSS
jgi:hypothetical protein